MKESFIEFYCKELLGFKPREEYIGFLNDIVPIISEFPGDPVEPPSSGVIPLAVSCNKNYYECMAAGINMFGDNHFVFSEVCEFIMRAGHGEAHGNSIIGGRIPGLGHPVYDNEDPRAGKIVGCWLNHDHTFPYSFQFIRSKAFDLNLCLNMAGALTPFLMTIGFTKYNIDSFPLLCRTIGMSKIYNKLKLSGSIKLGPSKKSIEKASLICSNK